MSKDAVFNLLEFHHRLEKTGKLRSREFRGMFLAEFLANKKREEAEFLSLRQESVLLLTSDLSPPVEMHVR